MDVETEKDAEMDTDTDVDTNIDKNTNRWHGDRAAETEMETEIQAMEYTYFCIYWFTQHLIGISGWKSGQVLLQLIATRPQ